jgi:peptidyl-prolyl cis-trans isomerase C
MTYQKVLCFILLTTCLVSGLLTGCNPREEKASIPQADSQPAVQPSQPQPSTPEGSVPALPAIPANLVADVDGSKLTQGQLDADVQKRFAQMKDQIPADRLQEVKAGIRKRLIDDFVVRTLLTNEVNRQKITVTDKEISEAVDHLKSSLPQGVTIEEVMKRNQINKDQMNEEIRFGIKINKLVLASMNGKTKPTDKEISTFYQKNKSQFKMPESVHVRHILVEKKPGDDDKTKTEKKAKAENIRKQILGGADFADIAKNQSDCPSKQVGGDLGTFARGQMVKPFEDASFSQKKNEIGPVVETDFGYHIIQVLEKNGPKTMTLDGDTKGKISAFLTQQKQQQAFDALLKNLREKARVFYYQK